MSWRVGAFGGGIGSRRGSSRSWRSGDERGPLAGGDGHSQRISEAIRPFPGAGLAPTPRGPMLPAELPKEVAMGKWIALGIVGLLVLVIGVGGVSSYNGL